MSSLAVLQVFRPQTSPEAIQLVSKLLDYTASKRLRPLEACLHPFFDELRQKDTTLPDKSPLPLLFNFSADGKLFILKGLCMEVIFVLRSV